MIHRALFQQVCMCHAVQRERDREREEEVEEGWGVVNTPISIESHFLPLKDSLVGVLAEQDRKIDKTSSLILRN